MIQSALADGAASLDGDDLRVLDQEVARLENLLQSFLDFARPAQLERREVDLRPIVAQTVTILTARAARRKVSIEYRPPRQAVAISGDEVQLRQVALNLLLNALDATPDEGRIWIEVGLLSDAAGDDWREPPLDRTAFLTVADNGRGLPPGDPERIFEPFFSTKETGLGLGLAICQRIVESHGGSIAAAERAGGGTIFTVELPVKAADANTPRATPATTVRRCRPKEPPMPKLLIVDDEPNLLYSLKKALRSDTLEVVTAQTAREGIDKVRELNPDVVLLDVRLPDMSGLDAFSEIAQIDSRCR